MTAPLAEIRKNKREVIRFTLDRLNGHDVFNVRVWFKAQDGEMRPGKSGLAFRAALLPEFLEAVSSSFDEVRNQGLLQGETEGAS